jgi:hypothetical protein
VECRYIQRVWESNDSLAWAPGLAYRRYAMVVECCRNPHTPKREIEASPFCLACCWEIWKERTGRCARTFDHKEAPTISLVLLQHQGGGLARILASVVYCDFKWSFLRFGAAPVIVCLAFLSLHSFH